MCKHSGQRDKSQQDNLRHAPKGIDEHRADVMHSASAPCFTSARCVSALGARFDIPAEFDCAAQSAFVVLGLVLELNVFVEE